MLAESRHWVAYGAVASALIGASLASKHPSGVIPYGIVGASVHSVHSSASDVGRSVIVGARAGGGLVTQIGTARFSVEAAPFLAVLGGGGGFLTFGPIPVTIGVAF